MASLSHFPFLFFSFLFHPLGDGFVSYCRFFVVVVAVVVVVVVVVALILAACLMRLPHCWLGKQ